jgi:hypothetical protein
VEKIEQKILGKYNINVAFSNGNLINWSIYEDQDLIDNITLSNRLSEIEVIEIAKKRLKGGRLNLTN